MEACPHCTSLMQMCMEELLFSSEILKKSIHFLPVKIHTMLFAEAALLLPRFGTSMKDSIVALVSMWPKEQFCIKDLVPDKHLQNVLHAGSHPSLISVIIEGLLNLQACCKLTKVDFTGSYTPSVYELPVMSLPKTERNSEAILAEVKKNCNVFLGDNIDDLFDILKWRLMDLSERNTPSSMQVKGPIDVYVECQLNLSDFMAVDDELLGLSVHQKSPFRMKVVRVNVDNYHHRQVSHFKGFFHIIKKSVLNKLVIYGKRRGINLVMWDMANEFDQLCSLKAFGLGTSGPKFHITNPDEPTMDEVFTRASVSLSKWTELNEIYFIGIVLTNQVSKLLGALKSPLKKLILYGCRLNEEDITFLSTSQHVPHLEELGLEYNNFHNMGSILCNIAEKAVKLCIFNLKETYLMLHEKVELIEALQSSSTLHTLVLYEKEEMLTIEGYETVLEMACLIDSLKEFYVFPFDYKPFEMFHRDTIEQACQEILFVNERTNLDLYY